MTKAQKIAHILNTNDWQSIDSMLRQGYTEQQIIRGYIVPIINE